MQRAFGLDIPQTLEDTCDPTRLALVVYDMQIGIVKQIANGQQITEKVLERSIASLEFGGDAFAYKRRNNLRPVSAHTIATGGGHGSLTKHTVANTKHLFWMRLTIC